ncbi:MAG: SDR family NAD(P)-dependent oxidoreductase [Verrucomicrobiota bacterium]|nr:SDR family NAD(P)-dependent oxidoreductase [Verrucomicrobiota bacterium]
MDLNGKVALITGGSRGVGAATALKLARQGCHVAINCNQTLERAKQIAGECQAIGVKVLVVPGDVSLDRDCRRIVSETIESFGQLDILINNAGTTRFINFHDLDDIQDQDWDRIMGVNLKGPFQCARAARQALESSAIGVIVNTASVAGITGAGSSIPYCASKAGVINLTLALARTFGPKIRVNAVAPGFIEGEWLQKGLGENYEMLRNKKAGEGLLDDVSSPDDIADGIFSMISCRKVTGHILTVDTGHTIGPKIGTGI